MRTHILLIGLLALASAGSKLDRLSEAEYDHYRALRVFMEEPERKEWLKLETSGERDAWLKEHQLWDRFYRHSESVRKEIVEGRVAIGWTREMVYMAWGQPFQKQRLTGRPAGRSELLVYRFAIDADGTATPLVGTKAEYKAVGRRQTELVLDDDVVAQMKEKADFE